MTIGDPDILPAVTLRDLDVMSMPDIRTNDVALIQRDGLWAGDDYIDGRTVALSIEVAADTTDEFNSTINTIMRAFSPGVGGETPFSFRVPGLCNGRAAYVNARTRKRSNPLDYSFAARYCAFEIELYATDPVVYAVDETAVTLRKDVPTLVPVDGSKDAKTLITFTNATNPKLMDAETGALVLSVNRSGTFTVPGPDLESGNRYLVLANADSAVTKFRDEWV
ncbi:hypothetical protein [Kitasatospora sp. NPDC001132]